MVNRMDKIFKGFTAHNVILLFERIELILLQNKILSSSRLGFLLLMFLRLIWFKAFDVFCFNTAFLPGLIGQGFFVFAN